MLVGTLVHLLTAGHEATAGALCKSVLTLLHHRGVLARLRAEPALLPGAVDELIRYDSPVQMITRFAYRPEELAGRAVGVGDRVTLVLGSANRDPRRFESPDEPVIGRRARHCGFGVGPHYCLGTSLGRIMVETALEMLFDALPGIRLTEQVEYGDNIVFHGPSMLVVETGLTDHCGVLP